MLPPAPSGTSLTPGALAHDCVIPCQADRIVERTGRSALLEVVGIMRRPPLEPLITGCAGEGTVADRADADRRGSLPRVGVPRAQEPHSKRADCSPPRLAGEGGVPPPTAC